MKTLLKTAALAAALPGGSALAADKTSPPTPGRGRWDAVLTRNGDEIPFRLDIKGDGPTLKGMFYDGFRPMTARPAPRSRTASSR